MANFKKGDLVSSLRYTIQVIEDSHPESVKFEGRVVKVNLKDTRREVGYVSPRFYKDLFENVTQAIRIKSI